MRRFIPIAFVALALVLALGCTKPKEKENPNVAVVNGVAIPRAEFEKRVRDQLSQHGRQEGAEVDEAKLRKALLEQMITEELLLQGAKEAGLLVSEEEVEQQLQRIKRSFPDDAAFQAQLRKRDETEDSLRGRIRDQLLISKFRASLVDPESVTEEEMKKYYQNAPSPLMSPARIKMRMIQATSQEEAERYAEAVKEKGFDKLADELAEGGKVVVSRSDWVQPDTFSKATAEAVKDAKIGDVVGPLKGMGGWYLMKIEDKEEPKVESYEEAKDKVRSLVLLQKRQGQEHIWVMRKKEKSKIETFL